MIEPTPDPMLMESIPQLLAASPPMQDHNIARELGVHDAAVIVALRTLVAEGTVEVAPNTNRGYVLTEAGRARAAETITAAMQLATEEDAAALVASMSALAPSDEELVALEASLDPPRIASWQVPEARASLVASMHQLAPSPQFRGFVASARHALEDHRKNPSLNTALRVRRMVRKAIRFYDPMAVPPLDSAREQAITAALAPATTPRTAAPQRAPQTPSEHGGCCGTAGTCRGRCGWPT